jgi:epoxyqueuosine reductase
MSTTAEGIPLEAMRPGQGSPLCACAGGRGGFLERMDSRQERFRQTLLGLGFDEVRFAAAGAVPEEHQVRLKAWVEAGCRAEMAWMDRSLEKRLDLEQVLPGVQSLILLGVNYLPAPEKPRTQQRWAKYALYEDYHDTVGPALADAGRLLEEQFGLTGTDYRYYVDTGPVLERGWAARAGLGWQGKNGMLISRTQGNWLFIAAILVRHPFVPDAPLPGGKGSPGFPAVGAFCGSCTRCMEACPTRAIFQPGLVDARLCISYQTIENKGFIPRDLREKIGGRIYGCDICLDVCPWNRFASAGRQLLLSSRFDLADLSLAELLALRQEDFSRIFARTAIKRLKWRGLLRNACIVAGNLGTTAGPVAEEELARLQPLLLALLGHGEPMVRGHALWALFRLWPSQAEGWTAAHRALETDPAVLEEHEHWEDVRRGVGAAGSG